MMCRNVRNRAEMSANALKCPQTRRNVSKRAEMSANAPKCRNSMSNKPSSLESKHVLSQTPKKARVQKQSDVECIFGCPWNIPCKILATIPN